MCTRLSIISRNSWSISPIFVISLNQSSCHFLCALTFAAGNFLSYCQLNQLGTKELCLVAIRDCIVLNSQYMFIYSDIFFFKLEIFSVLLAINFLAPVITGICMDICCKLELVFLLLICLLVFLGFGGSK